MGQPPAADSSPVVASDLLRRPLFYHADSVRSGSDLLLDMLKVSAHLGPYEHIINDCADRYFFTVLLLAAASSGKISLLPASHTETAIDALSSRYRNTALVTDNADNTGRDTIQISKIIATDNPPQQSAADIPRLADSQVIAIAFTSGSTGEPQAHPRTWRWAMQEAKAAGSALGLDKNRPKRIVCTTPPQHMYGFVSSIFIPLALGQASYRGRPFFPEEIREALSESGRHSLLVTTPTQIRACVRSQAKLPRAGLILSSAAPLDRSLAEQAEKLYLTQVVEFYGSTETGAIALRRPTLESAWKCFAGIRVKPVHGELQVHAGYLPAPARVHDQVEIIDERHFLLLGRSADLIKIGGKRESLARLNSILLAMEGVEDGAFVFTEASGEQEPRLAALVVAPGLPVKAIQSHLRKAMDAVFLPRPLKKVEALPRTAAGKLTRKALLALLKS